MIMNLDESIFHHIAHHRYTLSPSHLFNIEHNKKKIEDKITCIYEPPGAYLHHFVADDGTAQTIANGVLQVIHLYDSEESLLALGGDNCPTNTGSSGGAFFWIQDFLKRPLQLVLCLLHFIELPLKHLFKFYVGPTSGPRSWSSRLGKQISTLPNNLENIVDFEPVNGRVIAVDDELLTNSDQKYAYYLALGIQNGAEFLIEIMVIVVSFIEGRIMKKRDKEKFTTSKVIYRKGIPLAIKISF